MPTFLFLFSWLCTLRKCVSAHVCVHVHVSTPAWLPASTQSFKLDILIAKKCACTRNWDWWWWQLITNVMLCILCYLLSTKFTSASLTNAPRLKQATDTSPAARTSDSILSGTFFFYRRIYEREGSCAGTQRSWSVWLIKSTINISENTSHLLNSFAVNNFLRFVVSEVGTSNLVLCSTSIYWWKIYKYLKQYFIRIKYIQYWWNCHTVNIDMSFI